MPLFDDATPAHKRPADVVAQRPAPAKPEDSSRSLVRHAVEQMQLPPDERGKVERMATGLLPLDADGIAQYGRAALDEANSLSERVSAKALAAAQMGIDGFLSGLAEAMTPHADDGLLARLMRPLASSLDPAAVEKRLREMDKALVEFRADLGAVRQQLVDASARLERHSRALAALLPAANDTPGMTRAIQSRKRLIDTAASGMTMSLGMLHSTGEQTRLWGESIQQTIYIALPNWRALHSRRS